MGERKKEDNILFRSSLLSFSVEIQQFLFSQPPAIRARVCKAGDGFPQALYCVLCAVSLSTATLLSQSFLQIWDNLRGLEEAILCLSCIF